MTPADVIEVIAAGMCHDGEKRDACATCQRKLRAIEAVRRMGERDAALTDAAREMPGDTLRWDEEVDVIHAHVPGVAARISALESVAEAARERVTCGEVCLAPYRNCTCGSAELRIELDALDELAGGEPAPDPRRGGA